MTGGPVFRLGELARINAFFALADLRAGALGADPAWRPVGELLGDDAGIDRLVDQVAVRLDTTERWIAASILYLGWAEHLTSVYAGSIVLGGAVPDLAAVNLGYRTGQGGRLELGADRLAAVDATTGWRRLVDDHLCPLGDAVRRRVRIGRRLVEGSVASALAGSLAALDRAGLASLDELVTRQWAQPADVLPYGRWVGTDDGPRYARTTCCGYERLPQGSRCGDCALAWRSAG